MLDQNDFCMNGKTASQHQRSHSVRQEESADEGKDGSHQCRQKPAIS